MEQILVQCASASPEKTVVVEGKLNISYRELIARADILAQQLNNDGIQAEEPVCIYLESGYQQVIAQVAVLRAGGTCVPVEPSTPPLRLEAMLLDIEAQYIITCKDLADSVSKFKVIHTESATELQITLDPEDDITLRAGCPKSHRSHIMFTSGSTGRPKPIPVLARGIIHVLDSFPCHLFDPSDCMSQFINPGFDFSLFEIWAALLSGVTVVTVPKVIITDPATLGQFLVTTRIKTMIIPTALFNIIALNAPTSFRSLRHVLVGGEAVNATAMRKVLINDPPENLWNAYGPAEATIYVTLHRVDLKEAERSRISIGRPIGQTKVYLLDEQRRRVTDTSKWGEICISGPQLSPGYLNRLKETEEHFIRIDAASFGEVGSSIRLYRTGDIGQWRDDTGVLDYIGRSDKQIKRSGHRVELGDIERSIERHPNVHSCVVSLHQGKLSDLLVAYIIPTSWGQGIKPDDITDWAEERLPPYMVPEQIERVREFPLSANGKVNRKALRPDTHQNQAKEDPSNQQSEHKTVAGEWLQSTVAKILNVPHISPNDNVFDRGLTSLQAAQLIGQIMHHYGKAATLEELHEHPTLDGLAALLRRSSENKSQPSHMVRWEEDSHLADEAVPLPDWQCATEGRVFLTGATGFVGAYLLDRFLSMQAVKTVACLARSRGSQTAASRVQKALEKYNLWERSLDKMQKLLILDGELADETLGLGADKFHWLANWASVIFHVGARVNWCEPYEAHFEPNVLGTRNIIRLVCQGRRKALHYLSSIDAWNVTGFINKTKRVLEDEPLKPHMKSLPYDMGYAQSQWVADEMVQRARARGLPAAIYRPGFVIGDSQRAIGNPDDFFSRMIVACIQLKCFPHLPRQRLEYVTVDYVCSAMVHIASETDNLGRAYHLVSPDPTQSVNIEGTYHLLKQARYPMEEIPYRGWVEKIQQHPGNPLEPMLPMLQEPVFGDLTRMQTSTDTPVYDTRNTMRALADRPDIVYVPLSHELLRRYVEFWVRRHYYNLSQFFDDQ